MPKLSDSHLDDLTRRFVRQAPSRATRTQELRKETSRSHGGQGLMLLAIFGFGLIAVGGMVAYLVLR